MSNGMWTCPKCKVTKSKYEMTLHFALNDEAGHWMCSKCNDELEVKKQLRNHARFSRALWRALKGFEGERFGKSLSLEIHGRIEIISTHAKKLGWIK